MFVPFFFPCLPSHPSVRMLPLLGISLDHMGWPCGTSPRAKGAPNEPIEKGGLAPDPIGTALSRQDYQPTKTDFGCSRILMACHHLLKHDEFETR